jgi:hypothetical protein
MSNATAELDGIVLDETIIDDSANVENIAESSVEENEVSMVEVSTVKRGKGRPNFHPFAGRPYLLKDELQKAMQDKHAFVALMHEAHALTPERIKELGTLATPVDELNFTVQGPIIQVIDQLHRLRGIYGDKATVSISKDRLVSPTNKLYKQPIIEVITINGKPVSKRIYEEYSSSTIYGYCTVKL